MYDKYSMNRNDLIDLSWLYICLYVIYKAYIQTTLCVVCRYILMLIDHKFVILSVYFQ